MPNTTLSLSQRRDPVGVERARRAADATCIAKPRALSFFSIASEFHAMQACIATRCWFVALTPEFQFPDWAERAGLL